MKQFCWALFLLFSTLAYAKGGLSLYNLHLKEGITAEYRKIDGSYDSKAIEKIAHTLRCRQTQATHEIPAGLLELLSHIQDHFGGKIIQVVSGYRSPALNEDLRRHGHRVAKKSLHMEGKAIDIRIAGVLTRVLRDYALELKMGGVGFYPENDFVHVDVGQVRRW